MGEERRRLEFAGELSWEMEAWEDPVGEASVVRQGKNSPSEAEAGESEVKQVELLKKLAQAQKGAPSRKELEVASFLVEAPSC